MTSPLIGLTTYLQGNKFGHPIIAVMEKYANAIQEAGGVPVLIPNSWDSNNLQRIVEKIDGLLFTGGGDLLSVYPADNPKPHHFIDPDNRRDSTEFALLEKIIPVKKPFFGICRGLQVINVALGGTLYTHLPEQMLDGIKHNFDSGRDREYLAHLVRILPETQLYQIIQEESLEVNSLHHQGIESLSSSLIPSAQAADGLIEGIELKNYPFGLAVQWHPEWLSGQLATKKIFQAFINAAT